MLTCPVCGYRKNQRRDREDYMREAMARSGGVKCEGDCAYRGQDTWAATFLIWTDTIRVFLEYPAPSAVFDIVSGEITYGDGTTAILQGGTLTVG